MLAAAAAEGADRHQVGVQRSGLYSGLVSVNQLDLDARVGAQGQGGKVFKDGGASGTRPEKGNWGAVARV